MVRWFASWRTTCARQPDGIDLAQADQLASGHCSDPQPYGLGLLLDAARAPAWGEELAGEQEAVTRMVAARRAALSAHPGRSRDAKVPPARQVAVRLAAALASLVVVGGFAVAETGGLPTALQQRAHDMFSLLGVPAPDTERGQGDDPSGGADPGRTMPATTPNPTDAGTLDPTGVEARALCRVWNAAGRDPDGAAMDRQSWRTLVTIAGGKTRVPALCSALLDPAAPSGAAVSNAPTSHPGAGPANPGRSTGGKKNGGS